MSDKEKTCCPLFKPEKWDEKTVNWDKKKFIKESIPCLFHIPFFPMIGWKIKKLCKMADEAQKSLDMQDVLLLFHDPHPFKSELFLSVKGEVPKADNVTISGHFEAKVFDGPYNAIPKYMKEMDEYLAKKNKKAKDHYFHYAYCPGCAKKYGHNYMVLFAKV